VQRLVIVPGDVVAGEGVGFGKAEALLEGGVLLEQRLDALA
jgi:hypothetical protein